MNRSLGHRVSDFLNRFSDVVMAIGVVVILLVLVIRIPPMTLDWLIATNIMISAIILFVAMFVSDAKRLPSFPTILLLTTLFRLAINVGTTRSILLEADGGEIISTFGNFVVGGNYIVGGVIFLILVLIQFIVIAKGSERVAEVSARFTLDAMPGKQMSIDADMRNGLIGHEEAREQRAELERESKLYGAMDGAMKFVKGDVIAGIIISVINIAAGLIIGIVDRDLTAVEAAQTYGLLTIGDGLVTQIPALLVSVAAGFVVTRVGSAEKAGRERGVARDIFDQFLGQPRSLIYVGGFLLLIGVTGGWTGFPMAPFVVFGVLVLILSLTRWETGAIGEVTTHDDRERDGVAGERAQAKTSPLVLEYHRTLEALFASSEEMQERNIQQSLGDVRNRLMGELGVQIPSIGLRIDGGQLSMGGYALLVDEAPVMTGSIDPEQGVALCSEEEAANVGLPGTPGRVQGTRAQGLFISTAEVSRANAANIKTMTALEIVLSHVTHTLRRHAHEFTGIQQVSDMLERLKETHPDLVKLTIPAVITVQQLTEVVVGLLREQAPIGDLRAVLESVAGHATKEKDLPRLIELVRRDLRRALCAKLAVGRQNIPFYRVDREIGEAVRNAMVTTSDGVVLDMSYDDQDAIIRAMSAVINPQRHLDHPPVVLVEPTVRRAFADMISAKLPDVTVLSFEELATDAFALQEVATVNFDAAES